MAASQEWPWTVSHTRHYRGYTFEYLCNLIDDPQEAAAFRTRIATESARLDRLVAEATARPDGKLAEDA
jgi:hypothetical protein